MKWITFSDLHLKLADTLGKMEGNINSRLKDKLRILRNTCRFAVKEKVDFVVLLGDIFDRFNPPERLKDLFIQAIEPLLKSDITIYYVIGNHETDMQSYNFMATDRLLGIEEETNLQFIKEFYSRGFPHPNNNRIHFIPAMYKDYEIIEYLRNIKDKENSILFGHWETKEALIGEEEYRYQDGISHKEYEGFKRVYIGGFHKYQKYDNWMYPGSLCKKTFSERSDKKGFIYSKLDNGEIEDTFIPVPDREFKQIEIIEGKENSIPLSFESEICKIYFVGSRSWRISQNENEIVREFYKRGAHKVITDYKNVEEIQKQDIKVSVSTSFEDDIKEYLSRKKREDLVELGINILKGE